jgi:FkbM family methyltransferase
MEQNLTASFDRCMRYKESSQLGKLLLDPARCVKNQLRQKFRNPSGTLETGAAFHLEEFHLVAGEAISEGIACHGVIEPNLTGAFLKLVKPGQTALDVGMHLGYFSTVFARLVGPQGTVHSFEPTPSTREIAALNTRQFKNITVHPNAMWSSHVKMTFNDYGVAHMAFNSAVSARLDEAIPPIHQFEVETITLDEFKECIGGKIDVIKIDAETAEMEILRGGRSTLLNDKPVVSLEVGDEAAQHGRSRGLVEEMISLGYRAWEFRDGAFVAHVVQDNYVYDNLIFAPKETSLG